MSFLRLLAAGLGLAVSPAFFALACINSTLTMSAMSMPMDGHQMPFVLAGLTIGQDTTNALGSMWLMYLLMGIAHLPPWIHLASGGGIPTQPH